MNPKTTTKVGSEMSSDTFQKSLLKPSDTPTNKSLLAPRDTPTKSHFWHLVTPPPEVTFVTACHGELGPVTPLPKTCFGT